MNHNLKLDQTQFFWISVELKIAGNSKATGLGVHSTDVGHQRLVWDERVLCHSNESRYIFVSTVCLVQTSV